MPDCSDTTSERVAGGFIDAHVHLWTADTQRYPLAAGYSPARMQPLSFTTEDLFHHAKPVGVHRFVLIQMDFYGTDHAYLLDAMQKHPGVFSGVGVVDERAPDLTNQLRRLKQLGVRGVRITPSQRGDSAWLDRPGMKALWQGGAELQMALCPLIDPEDLLAVDAMCEQFQDAPVVVDHCARVGGDGMIRETNVQQLCRLARHPRTHVKLSAFYFLGKKRPPYDDLAPMIRKLYDAFGPERLMWASDSPFQVQPPHTYADALALVHDRLEFLSDVDRQWILRRTAERLFFADPTFSAAPLPHRNTAPKTT